LLRLDSLDLVAGGRISLLCTAQFWQAVEIPKPAMTRKVFLWKVAGLAGAKCVAALHAVVAKVVAMGRIIIGQDQLWR
jgi:hypothetical protein